MERSSSLCVRNKVILTRSKKADLTQFDFCKKKSKSKSNFFYKTSTPLEKEATRVGLIFCPSFTSVACSITVKFVYTEPMEV